MPMLIRTEIEHAFCPTPCALCKARSEVNAQDTSFELTEFLVMMSARWFRWSSWINTHLIVYGARENVRLQCFAGSTARHRVFTAVAKTVFDQDAGHVFNLEASLGQLVERKMLSREYSPWIHRMQSHPVLCLIAYRPVDK